MSGELVLLMGPEEARRLTEEVKADAAALWRKLHRLYEGRAHVALGYSSWQEYCAAEFDMGKSTAYRLLDAGRVVAALEAHSPIGESLPASEGVARELAPVLRDDEHRVVEVWRELRERHGDGLTAAVVHDAVRDRLRRGHTLTVMGSSASDEWPTPQALFDALHAEFGFELDVCALPHSAKCARYFTPQDDGLAQDWSGVCWMNPPYGQTIGEWVAKAHDAGRRGATVVCLVPARTDTRWWWEHCRHAEIRFLRGRLRFGDSVTGAPFPSVLVVFGRPACVKWWEWQPRAMAL